MKNFFLRQSFIAAILFWSVLSLFSQQSKQTTYPYFEISSHGIDVTSLPLKSSSAEVNISGVIADVTIRQTFQNVGDHPIEAVYVFPGSTRAAVYSMEMKIDGRVIKAEIQEKSQAKATYAEAKKKGQRTSLLEQNRPNVFTMNLANILPKDVIEITLKYTESVTPLDGVYTFVYPGVVGPRFAEAQTFAPTARIPYSPSESGATFSSSLKVFLSTGMPIQDITSNSHKIKVDYEGLGQASVDLHEEEDNASNRDFILSYQLAGNKIDTGLLFHESEKENHFMLTIQPPKKVLLENIPSREYIFVVDVSGSMSGFPSKVSQKLMRNLLSNLQPNDLFNVILFASTSSIYNETSIEATNKTIEEAINFVNAQDGGGGGTRLFNALERALDLPKCDSGLSRSIVVITDGYITVEKDVYDLIRTYQNEFNFFSFGIGGSVNRYLIEGIAHIGNSEPLVITSLEDAAQKAADFRKYISAPVLTNISIDWNGFEVYDIEPKKISDVFAEKPIVISGKYKGEPKGIIKVSGISGQNKFVGSYNTGLAKASKRNEAVKYLWARERIRMLDDYLKVDDNSENKKMVTSLGIKYNLLTNYTSFVAVDESATYATAHPDNESRDLRTVHQAVPIPEGVSMSVSTGRNSLFAVGADLKIVGGESSSSHILKYNITGDQLSEIEVLFLELEFANILRKLSESIDLSQMSGGSLNLVLTSKGKIRIKDSKDIAHQKHLFNRFCQEIVKENLSFRKRNNVYFKISFS